MLTRCFLIVPSGRMHRYLRRYSIRECAPKQHHCAKALLDIVPVERDAKGCLPAQVGPPLNDPRWPTHCAQCGYEFTASDGANVWTDEIYTRTDSGEECLLSSPPPGAMWFTDYEPHQWKGPDGRSLHVILPNGHEWLIDGPASNCTKKGDADHRCWIRHGEAPVVTVDKSGNTCSAGAGSILSGNYHGFLTNGVFRSC